MYQIPYVFSTPIVSNGVIYSVCGVVTSVGEKEGSTV
jgi:hypothetical protein